MTLGPIDVSGAENAESKGCIYPQSNATARPIRSELGALAANRSKCTSFYLDAVEGMSNDFVSSEGEDHHQGLARSHSSLMGRSSSFSRTRSLTTAISAACRSTATRGRATASTCSTTRLRRWRRWSSC